MNMPAQTRKQAAPDPVQMYRARGLPAAELRAVSGPEAGRIWLLEPGTHTIGSAAIDTVRIADRRLPAEAVRMTVGPRGAVSLAVAAGLAAHPGADIRISSIRPRSESRNQLGARDGQTLETVWREDADLLVQGTVLRRTVLGPGPDGGRSATVKPEQITFPPPPAPPRPNPLTGPVVWAPVLAAFGPAFLLHQEALLLVALLTPLLGVAGTILERTRGMGVFERELDIYQYGREQAMRDVREALREEWIERRDSAPDPAAAALELEAMGPTGWTAAGQGPVLGVRIGCGDGIAMLPVHDPADGPGHVESDWLLPNLPYVLDLAALGVLGVRGDPRSADALARWIVAQTALLNPPSHLELHVVADQSVQAAWAWTAKLPHTVPPPAAPAKRGAQITRLIASLDAGASSVPPPGQAARFASAVQPAAKTRLLVLDGASAMLGVPGVPQLLADGPSVGVFVLCIEGAGRPLPAQCRAVVTCFGDTASVHGAGLDVVGARPDAVSAQWADRVASLLSASAVAR